MDRNKSLLWFVLIGLALLFLIANLLSPTIEYSLIFLVINQVLLGIGGFLGSPKGVFHNPTLKSFSQGVLWGLVIFVVNSIVGSITITVASLFLENEQIRRMILQDQAGVVSLLKTGNPLIMLIMSFLLVVGAPLSEEFFFRGFLISLWKEKVGAIRSIFLSALLFSVLHFYVLQFPQVLISGILLGTLFVRTKNIAIPIIAHGIVNTLGLVIVLIRL